MLNKMPINFVKCSMAAFTFAAIRTCSGVQGEEGRIHGVEFRGALSLPGSLGLGTSLHTSLFTMLSELWTEEMLGL